jgi:hemoglobin
MSSLSLVDRLGGRAGLRSAVIDLYERILDDAELISYFDDVDLHSLRTHMVDFLIAALTGAPDGYSGRPLEEAHGELGITDAAFDRVVFHLCAVLADAGVERDEVDQVISLLAPLRPLIVR